MSYVKLEGLGKIPFSNIRRPKPLMDVEPAPAPTKPEQGTLPLRIVAFHTVSWAETLSRRPSACWVVV